MDANEEKQIRKTLNDQARAIGLEVDGRWSVETLAEKVQGAQEQAGARAAQAVRQSSDTWVYLFRNATPVEGEEHPKGSIVKVPRDMAGRWYKAGVARAAADDEIPDA